MQNFSEVVPPSNGVEEYADVNWDSIGFNLTPTDYMYIAKSSEGENFTKGTLIPFGNLELNPCATVLQYGQGLFEGLKAYRKQDNNILLFRPEQNALRMQMGADRLCMNAPSVEQFVEAVKQTVLANKRWVPPTGKGALYIRPMLIGTGIRLGVGASPDYTFLVFVTPVGSYHQGQTSINLMVESKFHRATPGGTGDVKAIGNYSPSVKAVAGAKAKGFSDVIFLDSVTGKYIEEVSSCNIFLLKGNVLSTPETNGNILPGITRKSILELAKNLGYQVEEREIPVEELCDADEVFCTGTAVVVTPVSSITHQGKRFEYKTGKETVAKKLYEALTGIQTGSIEDKQGWTIQI